MNEEIKIAISNGDIEYLIEVVYGDTLESRISAVEGIAAIGGRKAVRTLIGVAGNRQKLRPEVRSVALEALGGICAQEEYASILCRFINGENPKLTTTARRILKSVDPDGFAGHLVEKRCLDYRAISAYGRHLETGAVSLLGGFIDERICNNDVTSIKYWGRVYIATGALGRIGGEEAVRILDKLGHWCGVREQEAAGVLHGERLRKIREALETALGCSEKG